MSWKNTIGKQLKEIRFVFCQNSERSQGMRNFIATNYFDVKKESPYFPFIVRECEDADPTIIARYRFGVEKKAHTDNLSASEIE
mmetsp:Transcript_25176/g.22203  ORF Transcript_25176/g.22203 Transcript_25176/m.22203 type:complete len:84 (-) Transcript_25176:191-442(-)